MEKVLPVLDRILRLNSQFFLLTETLKLSVKIYKHLNRLAVDNGQLADQIWVLNKAVKNGDVKQLETIVSSLGIPHPMPDAVKPVDE